MNVRGIHPRDKLTDTRSIHAQTLTAQRQERSSERARSRQTVRASTTVSQLHENEPKRFSSARRKSLRFGASLGDSFFFLQDVSCIELRDNHEYDVHYWYQRKNVLGLYRDICAGGGREGRWPCPPAAVALLPLLKVRCCYTAALSSGCSACD